MGPGQKLKSDSHEMVIFWSKIDFFKKCPDRSESVIYDQEMSQSVQFIDFKLDWWTFIMFPEELKNYKFLTHGQLLVKSKNLQKVFRSMRKCHI